jgi:LuxR family transcriptional regulator
MGSLSTQFEQLSRPAMRPGPALACAMRTLEVTGFNCTIYDYSPVALSHEGILITPSVLEMVNAPTDMEALWCNDGYYQLDPVQEAALMVSRPFLWSHRGGRNAVLQRVLSARHSPVVDYLHDTRLTCGITVPIRFNGGDLATFTAIRIDPEPDFEASAERFLAEIGELGHLFHDTVYPGFDAKARTSQFVRLTARERQCLRLSASGLTAKQIAYEIGRSIPTATLHLSSAARKLGARNRFQAIALAAHYRLLEPDA